MIKRNLAPRKVAFPNPGHLPLIECPENESIAFRYPETGRGREEEGEEGAGRRGGLTFSRVCLTGGICNFSVFPPKGPKESRKIEKYIQ